MDVRAHSFAQPTEPEDTIYCTNKIAKTGKSEGSEVERREDMGLYRRLLVGYNGILRSPSPTLYTVH